MAYSEFYCQSGGSNLNAGSTTNNTALATQTGDWVSATHIFTPNDGTNPVSLGIAVGMFASVYVTAGATVTGYVARISAVTNATNGATTVDNNVSAGASPANSSGAHTITMKVGGAWLGPNGSAAFPFSLTTVGTLQDTTSHQTRVNMKNDQTYSITSVLGFATTNSFPFVIQGYTSSTGDGGKATWDGGTSTGALISDLGQPGSAYIDHIFKTSITTGTTVDLVITGARANLSFTRCVFTGARQKGLSVTGAQCTVTECEAYGNNVNNNSSTGAFHTTSDTTFKNCISHDNAGSNTSGFEVNTSLKVRLENCIADTNGLHGIRNIGNSVGLNVIENCDFYNNGTDGINISAATTGIFWIENCNFFKNAGKGINNAAVGNSGFLYNNVYGAGTQANSSTTANLGSAVESGSINYASNVTPWNDPANGDFTITLATAKGAGRGAFLGTTNTTGYPAIGAVNPVSASGGVSRSRVVNR